MNTVVCCITDAPLARCCARTAAWLAKAAGARLVLATVVAPVEHVTVSHGLASTVPGTGSSDAEELLARVAEEAELPSEAERRVLEARDPTRALAALAVTEMAELLVVGARGRGRVAAAALGSVSRGLVAAAPCPVVVVPAAAACERAEGRGSPSVVCAVDRSTDSREVVRVAASLAVELELELVLVHVGLPPSVPGISVVPSARQVLAREGRKAGERLLADIAETAAGHVDAEPIFAFGDLPGTIADVCRRKNARLAVVGARGGGPLREGFRGSVSAGVIGKAPCPVVVVPNDVVHEPPVAGRMERG